MAFPARLFFWAWLLHCNHLRSPIFSEFNTTRSSTSSCLITVTASDLKNSYNLSFINQDSAARSSRISCKIAWVDLFRWGGATSQASKHSMAFHGYLQPHRCRRHGEISWYTTFGLAKENCSGEAVMPMCKYFVDHNHKVAQGRCDLSNTSPQACFYMYVSMQWQEYYYI